ncbi:MAG: metallophosphoesterase [Polyangia bacterium]|jgi:predicted phosphodiesterase
MQRHLILPARGRLLVSTDVHGNEEDIATLEAIFVALRAQEPQTHWVILGDVVHAPDAASRQQRPDLYDYDDGSMQIVDRILAQQHAHPGHVHFVLGNHDHGHVGGPHTSKFYSDEVNALEDRLHRAERKRLQELFRSALFAVAAPCGVLLSHGAPDESLSDLRMLDETPLEPSQMSAMQRRMMRALLTSYGQPEPTVRALLDSLSKTLPFPLSVVIHGHDRDDSGYFYEGSHQLCPCLFGAPRQHKRYVLLDLSARYQSAQQIRVDEELLLLYPDD